jgi:hypothetical protein
LSRQFSPPPPVSLTVINNKNSTNSIISTIKNENYEDDLPPPPPPPVQQSVQIIQNNCSQMQQQKQPLILDYQDPINIQYDAANLQFILPINVETNTKPCNLYSQVFVILKKNYQFFNFSSLFSHKITFSGLKPN